MLSATDSTFVQTILCISNQRLLRGAREAHGACGCALSELFLFHQLLSDDLSAILYVLANKLYP